MKTKFLILLVFTLLLGVSAQAQNGGKAEAMRIEFAKGKSSGTVTGNLKGDEQFETVFGAKEGQKVKIQIVSTTPKGKFHSFKVFGADDIDFTSELDKNYTYEFVVPTTGDYNVFVVFQGTNKVRSGKFSLTLSIRN